MESLGLYVHIPFCKRKCKYCDFISFACEENVYERYINALKNEIKVVSKNIMPTIHEVDTIYIGGGTPSIIDSKYIEEIIETIYQNIKVAGNAEVTIEVNPGTVTREKLEVYKKLGINRLSIGLQSANNDLLNLIGRVHTYEEFLDVYNMAREVGFTNINVDLMLALPTQTESVLVDSLLKVINLKPNHISLYSLISEEGTALEKEIEEGKYSLIDEEIERKMYHKTKNILEKNGYNHYEISNFAKKGFESKHNLNCWDQKEYLGFGLAAHSYYRDKRFSNTQDLDEYINNIEKFIISKNVEVHEIQDREAKAKEFMLLGLRKIDGVSISEFERRFRVHPLFYFRFEISRLEEEELIEVDLDKIRLTKRGLDLANQVFEAFV